MQNSRKRGQCEWYCWRPGLVVKVRVPSPSRPEAGKTFKFFNIDSDSDWPQSRWEFETDSDPLSPPVPVIAVL